MRGEKLYDVAPAAVSGEQQRGVAVVIAPLHVAAERVQELDDGQVAVVPERRRTWGCRVGGFGDSGEGGGEQHQKAPKFF